MTTLTENPTPRARAAWITPLLAIVGTLALLVAVGTATFAGIRMFTSGHTSVDTASVQGVTALDVDSAGAEFTVVYGDVSEATLEVEGLTGWKLERRDSTITVRPPTRWFGGWWLTSEQHVTLTLPIALETQGLDAAFEVNSGRFTASGEFDELKLRVNAGSATVEGSSADLDVIVNAGEANVDIRDVREADLEINAGRIAATFVGATPEAVEIEVNAGELVLVVPDDVYSVSSEVNAGRFDGSRLQTASASSHRIEVQVSAGSATVRPAS